MNTTDYNTRAWRELPRDGDCVVLFLFGEAAGPCEGPIHRHHVDPPHERSVQVCRGHHPQLEAVRRQLLDSPIWKRCPHKPGTHRYDGAKEACERVLNRDLLDVLEIAA